MKPASSEAGITVAMARGVPPWSPHANQNNPAGDQQGRGDGDIPGNERRQGQAGQGYAEDARGRSRTGPRRP